MVDVDAEAVTEFAETLTPDEITRGGNIWPAFIQFVLAHNGAILGN